MKYILGIKKGMTRVYDGDKSVPVTVLDTSGCVVSHTDDKGTELGIGSVKGSTADKGKYKGVGYVPQFRMWVAENLEGKKVGDSVEVADFEAGEIVDIKGVTKGKGFEGVVKRWGFAGGSRTHGQSDRQRAPGSIGAGTDPGRVWKGLKMGGRMGGDNITVQNKRIVDVKDNYILISGAVPGGKGTAVLVQTVK